MIRRRDTNPTLTDTTHPGREANVHNLPHIPDEPWMADGLCKTTDWDSFHPERGDLETARNAKRTCQLCTVRVECLDYAMAHDERYGIWGGLTGKETQQTTTRTGRKKQGDSVSDETPDLIARVEDAIWTELKRQASEGTGPYVDRDMDMVDTSGGGGIDMTAVAHAVIAALGLGAPINTKFYGKVTDQ